MLLGILLIVLVLYGLLLFWVLNERLKEVQHLLRSLAKKVDRLGERRGLPEERGEEESIAEDRFPLYLLEDEIAREKGEGQ